MAQNSIAYYPFDNDVLDKSGFNNNGIIHGNTSYTMDRFGNPCGALYFDGKTGYVEVPSSPSLESPSTDFSVAVWYKLTAKQLANYWLTVICKGNTANEIQNPQYRLQVQQNFSGPINSCNSGTAGSSTISVNTEFTKCDNDFQQHLLEPEKWNFYVITYDGKIIRAYMNEKNIFNYPASLQLPQNKSPLYIGLDEPGVTEYFEGSLDDLRIYNKALSLNEITNLYNESRNNSQNYEEFELEQLQNKIAYLTKNNCTVKVNYDPPKVTTHCGNVNLTQISGLPTGSNFNCGRYLITYEAKSISGYIQNCSFYVIVKDTIPPILIMPHDTTILVASGQKGTLYSYQSPTAIDNCKIKSINLIEGIQRGLFFPLGKNAITYDALDIYNNMAMETFYVTVQEKDESLSLTKVAPPKTIPKVDIPKTNSKIDTLKIIPKVDSTATQIKKKEIHPPPEIDSVKATQQVDSIKILLDTTSIPQLFTLREVKKQEHIEVDSQNLRVELYDNAEIDGDSVSLFLNHKMLLSNQLLGLKPIVVWIEIDSTIDNELALFAENEGSIPPNTALLILWDGDKRYQINLTSTMKSNGAIVIRKKKNK